MIPKFIKLSVILATMLLAPLTVYGVSGDFSDAGGGTYWCNVYVASVSSGKSYSWCTGDGEEGAMENFRGFESEHNGKITTEFPGINISFRYHRNQSKDFEYDGSRQEIYVVLRNGTSVKIAEWIRRGPNWSQTDFTYGIVGDVKMEGDMFKFRYVPNEQGIKSVESIKIENETFYHQSNFWHRNYDFSIHSTYQKKIGFELTKSAEPQLEWAAPGKLKVKADNSGLPKTIGNGVNNFKYTGDYTILVRKVDSEDVFSRKSFTVDGRNSETVEMEVPIDKSFSVEMTYATKTSLEYNGNKVSQNLEGSTSVTKRYETGIYDNVKASMNQVESSLTLSWASGWTGEKGYEFKVYRTELDEKGATKSNRELIGSTKSRSFADNPTRDLKLGKYYRYEVVPMQETWGDLNIPSDPATLKEVHFGEVRVNTTPVIPLHLIQDKDESENIKFNWTFGNIPKNENDLTFKVHRVEPSGGITRNYLDVTVPRTAGKASFSDEKPESHCTVYGYFLQLDLADNQVHIYSDTIYGHVLGTTVVTDMSSTKGTAGTDVEIKWNAKQVGTSPTLYAIQRRFLGKDEWVTIQQVEGTASVYSYTDKTTEPGRYYEYRVVSYATDCEGSGRVISNQMRDVGFAQSFGVVSGRVQYETGTAVDGVRVSLSRESDEQNRASYYSRHITDNDGGVTWEMDKEDGNQMIGLDKAFTVQMWINPSEDCDGSVLYAPDGHQGDGLHDGFCFYLSKFYTGNESWYELRLAYATEKSFNEYKNKVVKFDYRIPVNEYTQLTLRFNGDSKVEAIFNGNVENIYRGDVLSMLKPDSYSDKNDKVNVNFAKGISVPNSNNNPEFALKSFTGYLDEVRYWNRELTDKEVVGNYDRLLSGREDGLKLYWTFDEGLQEYAFDNSSTNGVSNGNHAILGNGSRPSEIVPSDRQLSTYGLTNEKGEYEIRGIPFTGSGTRYSVYPTKGIHTFNPTSRSAFIGGTSLNINNTDFTDASSFKVHGTIRYSGTTIPVDSVSFYVDGIVCNKNDKLIMTDANGEFEISVPVGNHYIEARRTGHTFEAKGRYPQTEGETHNFMEEMTLDFYDNTLATVAGRLTGGQTEGKKPLGYGVSQNTVGQAVIKLSPLDHPQRMLNAVKHVDGTTSEWVANTEKVEVESASTAIKSTAYREGGSIDDAKYIYITTDAATGEFSAKLPPIRYKVESVKIPNNEAVEKSDLFKSIPAIDLRNPRDTIIPDTLYNEDKKPLPLFKCNRKLLLTYRSSPVMDITQLGLPKGAFGTDTIVVTEGQEELKLPIFFYDETSGKVTYTYKYPIFQRGRTYEFKIRAYEPYTNYDKVKTGKLYEDMLRDSVITFDNEIGEAAKISAMDQVVEGQDVKRGEMVQLESEQVKLDENGEGRYKWVAGMPILSAPYTRDMNASMVVNGTTRLWRKEGLSAVIAGIVPTGSNFITAGPSYVQMVLRDPPGDASSASWATDTVTNKYTYTTRGIHHNTEFGIDRVCTAEMDIVSGTFCFKTITYNSLINDNTGTWGYNADVTWDYRKTVTFTNSSSISTSGSPTLVGRDGDVFIGYSTNYIIGAGDKVGLFKQPDGQWDISMEETMTMDEKFNTHFQYSQKYIEGTLFNNIKRTRNSKLKRINSLSEIEENPKVPTYYTLLKESDARFGTSNDDKAWGSEGKSGVDGPSYYARYPQGYEGCDSVRWFNEVISSWEGVLADNEEDKIKAFNDAKMFKGNESFERGVKVDKTLGKSSTTARNYTKTFRTTIAYKGKNGYMLNKSGALFISNVDVGYHQTINHVDEVTANQKFSYSLNNTQRGNAHTVDVYDSPRGWAPIFRTRGGQSRCPYEGERKTKYYKPGTALDAATMKSDNPHINIPIRNYVNVPAGKSANIEITLTNDSETHDAFTSVLVYVDPKTNPDGLQVLMDGDALLDGVEVWLEYGIPMKKTITVTQSNQAILDYKDIKIQLLSTCDYAMDPASAILGREEYDSKSFSVHFVPAAPAVKLSLDKTQLNQRAVESGEELTATISDINRSFRGLKGIRLKYRFAGDVQWITAHEWLTDKSYLTGGKENDLQSLLTNDSPDINYTLKLPDFDGTYQVAAESICLFDEKEFTNATAEQNVVRDTRGPKLLGQAYPNAGILTPTDDISIKFNENIRDGYLTKDGNFFITGSLNDARVSHDVSLQFNGNPIETEAYLPISNTSFASSLWLKRKSGGTILEHGTEGNSLKILLDEKGQVVVDINGKRMMSKEAVPADRWVFLAMNYVKGLTSKNNTLSMLMADGANETMLFDDVKVPDYNANGRLSLGKNFTGMMNELVLWDKNNPVRTQLGQKDEVKASYLPGLVGYWKMNEGHGTTVTDYARSRNIYMTTETWNVENTNLAAHLDGQHTIKLPIGLIAPRPTDSYVVETWFRGEKGKNANTTLLSVTDRLSIGFDNDNSLLMRIYNDTLPSTTTTGLPVILSNNDYSDGNWHHLALNVRRGIGAVAYVDGNAVKTMAEQELPVPAGDYLYVGSILKRDPKNEQLLNESNKFTGDVDEIRIWNAACDGTSIIANRYNQVDTATASGLVAYYPMEHSRLGGNSEIVTEFSLINKAPGTAGTVMEKALGDGVVKSATAPALRTAPLRQNLDYDYTASSNEIYINLKTLPARMQGNLLTFVVKNVRDMCDNLSEPITWSAVVDYNTLEWNEKSVVVDKDRLSEYTVLSTIHNKGRQSGKFTLTGMPKWVVPSTESGTLGVDETVPLKFTIGADAPVGTHNVYVYAVNDDGIYSPLLLQVTVHGNEPDWAVNPDEYESSMNIVGQIYYGDRICSDVNTKIAAFVNGECRGVASPKLVRSRDAYYVSLTVYGVEDVTKPQPIDFRIYDAEEGVVLAEVDAILDDETLSLNYTPNDLVGDYDHPVMWMPLALVEQVCNLKAGWNWISLYVRPDEGEDDLESIFGHAKVFNTVKSKDGFAMNSGAKWSTSGLEKMEMGNLYKVKVKSDVNQSIFGIAVDSEETSQTIYPGWNWIGPLSYYNLSLAEAFADLNPTRGDIVKSKNAAAFYDGYKWEGDLTALIPGVGYYYKSLNKNNVTFHYPLIYNYSAAPARESINKASKHSPFTPVDHHQFSDNMNVVAQVMVNDVPVDTLTVAAFIGDECRGVTTATEDGYYLLTIAGNASEGGQEVTFATVYKDKVVKLNETLTWYSDVIYGDLDEPTKLTISTSGIDEVQEADGRIVITPAIVRDLVKVHSGSLLKSVEVYSANGALVEKVANIGDNMISVNLSHLPDGIYFVSAVTLDNNKAVKRILKR